jgi:hypothetical protein
MAKLDSIDEEEWAMVAKKMRVIDEGDRHIEANRIANERMRLEIAAKEKQTSEINRQSSYSSSKSSC